MAYPADGNPPPPHRPAILTRPRKGHPSTEIPSAKTLPIVAVSSGNRRKLFRYTPSMRVGDLEPEVKKLSDTTVVDFWTIPKSESRRIETGRTDVISFVKIYAE
jgi:hypothetical protein